MHHVDRLLTDWARWAERHWTDLGGGVGFFGTGYNAWGVQTNQKYLGTMAHLATGAVPGVDQAWALDRAVAALRYSLDSHHSGSSTGVDGSNWGHTWISVLGIERMMFSLAALGSQLPDEVSQQLDQMLASEAEWLTHSYQKGNTPGIVAGPWNSSGRNVPESNLWNGAFLWRVATRLPDDPRAEQWREQSLDFLINAASISSDATSELVVDGLRVADLHKGANFHDGWALDHHGYLNVGYMVVTASQAAIGHFDLGDSAPEALHLHQEELWRTIKRLIFSDGRLARVGGDTRVRYAYCQEYLLPVLAYAADQFGDPHALGLLDAQVELIAGEADHNGDGSFYGERLTELGDLSPLYTTRLESDRAVSLAMTQAALAGMSAESQGLGGFEESVAGHWHDPDHGVVVHRSPNRLASVAWRASGRLQAMCQPPDDGHLAEWSLNLSPDVTFLGDSRNNELPSRRLIDNVTQPFDGGFLSWGRVTEGASLSLAEGWTGADAGESFSVFAALPDGVTLIGMHLVRAGSWRPTIRTVKGLHLNVPNDLYNGFSRTYGEISLTSPPAVDDVVPLGRSWTVVDDRIGVVGVYGAEELVVDRRVQRRGGPQHSLYVDELCYGHEQGFRAVESGDIILDVGFAVLSGADSATTESFAVEAGGGAGGPHGYRSLGVRDVSGQRWMLQANACSEPLSFGDVELGPWSAELVQVSEPQKRWFGSR